MRDPLVVSVVRRQDGLVLVLWGYRRVDLPATILRPGESPLGAAREKLLTLGVDAKTLLMRWVGASTWNGSVRPITAYDVTRWSGEPQHGTDWAREEQVCVGANAAVYKTLFAKLRAAS